MKMETLLLKIANLNFQYDFIIKHYLQDVSFRI